MIRVFSWNILADSYARCDSYPYAFEKHLKWQHRWPHRRGLSRGLQKDAQKMGWDLSLCSRKLTKPDEERKTISLAQPGCPLLQEDG